MPIVRRSLSEIIKRGGGQVDLDRIRRTTDEEIDAMIASDPDTAPDMSIGRDWRRVISPRLPDVRAIRRKLRLSQAEFAKRFGFSVRTVQEWEQGRAVPDRPARILLRVIEKSPKAVERAVAAGREASGESTCLVSIRYAAKK
jgi:putative transcriptional regulator